MKTKAAVLRNINGPLIIEELEIPVLKRGQVLVKILYSGLCHSNINEIRGRKGANFIPHLTGHEASAIVMEVGEGVSKVRENDYVVCSWVKGSGLEVSSVKYQSNTDIVNAGACSTFVEYAIVSENRIVKIPREVEPIVASLLGCAVQVGASIIDKSGIKSGQKLAVFGIGGIGASVLIRAISLGIECYAFDVMSWKLNWVRKELGVIAVHFDDFNIAHFNDGFDFSVECSGNKAAMETAYECLKSNGTAIIAGNLKPGEKISIDYWGLLTGKTLKGAWGGLSFLDADVPFYALSYIYGSLPIDKLITKVYPFNEINAGLEDLESGRLVRGVIKILGD